MEKRLERRAQQREAVLHWTAVLLKEHTAEALKMSDLAKDGRSVGGLLRTFRPKKRYLLHCSFSPEPPPGYA